MSQPDERIDSFEKYLALYSEVCGERITGGTFSYQHMATKRWWMMRELQRFAIGQYMPVPQLILLELAKYTSTIPLPMTHFLHMSKEEPGMVAYTADFENGVRDRQLRIGFGKYMTKHAFWLLDHHVQRLEMMLRAELSTVYEVHMGGEAIIHWYVNGPHSCMVPGSNTNTDTAADANNKLRAYDAPGWGIAIVRKDGEAGASARSLVWIDPQDESRKFYIRCYGDAVLQRQLLRDGFKNEIPTAPLRYVDMPGYPGNVHFPYFDSTADNRGGDGGKILFTEDKPIMLSKADYNELYGKASHRPFIHQVQSTSAHGTWQRMSPTAFRCGCCGVLGTAEAWSDYTVTEGRRVCDDCENNLDLVRAQALTPYWTELWLPRAKTMLVEGRYYRDERKERYSLGVISPDRALYPDGPELVKKTSGDWKEVNGVAWHRDDLVKVVSNSSGEHALGAFTIAYRNVRDTTLNLRAMTKLTPRSRGERIFAAEGTTGIKLTRTGRRVIPGVHDVVKLYGEDDAWAPKSQCIDPTFYGKTFWFYGRDTLFPLGKVNPADIDAESIANSLFAFAKDRGCHSSLLNALNGVGWALPTNSMIPVPLDGLTPYLGSAEYGNREPMLALVALDNAEFGARIANAPQEAQLSLIVARAIWRRIRTEYDRLLAEHQAAAALEARVEPAPQALPLAAGYATT
jgi:hypothetical protein